MLYVTKYSVKIETRCIDLLSSTFVVEIALEMDEPHGFIFTGSKMCTAGHTDGFSAQLQTHKVWIRTPFLGILTHSTFTALIWCFVTVG